MVFHFPFINIEGKNYPTVIMGEDRFTWFRTRVFTSEKDRAKAYQETIETAYMYGVRGFSMSPHPTVMRVLKSFKRKHPDIVCISNHHYQFSYYLGKESLWRPLYLDKLIATLKSKLDPSLFRNNSWLKDVSIKDRFTNAQLKKIRLDESEYRRQLRRFHFCDFFLVGNIGTSLFLVIGRDDIIRKEIELVRRQGGIPIGMCQGTGYAIPKMESLDVAGYWGWINWQQGLPTFASAVRAIRKAKKPVTAYRVFSAPSGFDFKKSIRFVHHTPHIRSIVVGIENKEQAKETFAQLRQYFRKHPKRWQQ